MFLNLWAELTEMVITGNNDVLIVLQELIIFSIMINRIIYMEKVIAQKN